MTLTIRLSDNSVQRVQLHTVPGYDSDLAVEDALDEVQSWTGMSVADWECS